MDLDLPDFPPHDPGRGHVGNMFDLGFDHIIGQVVKLPFVEPSAHEGDEDDRYLGNIEFADDGILDILGQVAMDQVDGLQYIRLGAVQVGSPVEIDRDQGSPLPGNGGDIFHPIHRGDRFFHGVSDHSLHILGVCSRVKGGHRNGRKGDIREHIHGQFGERDNSQNDGAQNSHQKGDGVTKRESG